MTDTVFVCSLPICGHTADHLPSAQAHVFEQHPGTTARWLTQPADIEHRTVRLAWSAQEWTVLRESKSYDGPERVLVARKSTGGQIRETRWVARADLELIECPS